MTATERLRQLLDERGVEWRADVTDIDNVTEWDADPAHAVFYESKTTNPDMMEVRYFWPTPEQAVDATLGRGTCELTMDGTDGCFGCSECLENIPPLANFCPNCGRRVES